jgi:hypothetical protein
MTEKMEKVAVKRQDHPFQVSSITRAEAPEGAISANWYRYEIAQGPNEIVGHREGTLQAVTQAVADIVLRLNERRLGKAGRVHLTPGPKKGRGG